MSRGSSARRSFPSLLVGGTVLVAALLAVALWLLRLESPASDSPEGRLRAGGPGVGAGPAEPVLPAAAVAEREALPAAERPAETPTGADDGALPDYPRGRVLLRLVVLDGSPLPPELTIAAGLRRPYPRIARVALGADRWPDELADGYAIGDERLRAATRTAPQPDGSFVLEDVPTSGAWLVVDDDRLYAPEGALLRPSEKEQVIGLVRGARIVGRVHDAQGQPLPGTELDGGNEIDPFAVFDDGMTIVRLEPVTADAAGHFVLAPVPPEQALRITAQLPAFEIAVSEVPPLPAGGDHGLDLTLVRGASLAGRVLDEQDAPVPAVRVMLQSSEFSMGSFDVMGKLLETEHVTDEQGAFRFDGLSPGGWRVRLAADGWRKAATDPIELQSGQDVDGLVLRAQRGLSLAGRVVDPDGNAIAGARVEAALPPSMVSMQANMDRQYRSPTTSDEQGRFELSGYEEGRLRVWAAATGFVSSRVDAEAGSDDVLITLGRKTSLAGIAIRLADAEPLADYRLTFLPAEGLFDMTKMFEMDSRLADLPRPEHVQDDEGRFLVEDVPPGRYDITLTAEGYARTVLAGVEAVADTATTGLVLMVPEEARVSGLVVSARDGQPVPEARVTTGPTDMLTRMQSVLAGDAVATITDGQGRFVLGGLGREPLSLTVSHESHVELGLPAVAPRVGEELDLGVLTLPTGAAVWGTVRDGERRPVAGAPVMVSDNTGTTFKRTESDAEGAYRVDGLRAGSYNIVRMDFTMDTDAESATSYLDSMIMRTVRLEEHEQKRVDLVPDGDDGVRLEGTIRSAGAPEAGAMVWVLAEEGDTGLRMATSDAEGRYSIGGLESGPYLLQVLPSSDVAVGSGSQPVAPVISLLTLDSAPVQRHDVVVPGGELAGRVVDESSGKGAAGCRVVLERTDDGLPASRILAATGGRVGELYTEPDGAFRFGHLASGTYDLLAGGTNILGFGEAGWAATRLEGVQVVETRKGLEVEVEVRPGGGITGVVSDEEGRPLAGIPIWARDDRNGRWLATLSEVVTDSSGRYTVNSLEPGPWTLAFGGTTHALTLSRSRVVSRDALADLDIELERGVEVWVDTSPHDPRTLAAHVLTSAGPLPLHLASIDALIGGRPDSQRLRVGRVAPGTYDVSVIQGLEPLLQRSVRVTGEEDPLVLTLEP